MSSEERFSARSVGILQLPSDIKTETFDYILAVSSDHGASDVMFRSGTTARARINGFIQPITDVSIDAETISNFIATAETGQLATSVIAGRPRSFAYRINNKGQIRRFRMSVAAVNEMRTDQGLRLICRPIDDRPPGLDVLKLPQDLIDALTTPNNKGIILVTGETGSGKSTLLASTLDAKARKSGIHIATLEDPIEFNLFYLNQETDSIVGQAGLGTHLQDFPTGLKGLLRDNPDVIMVGEMRDSDTIKLAVEASRTGHLVYSTLHVTSVAATVDRICVNFSDGERLAIASTLIDSLRCIVNQELAPKLCQKCSVPLEALDPILENSGLDQTLARKPAGCEACDGSGFNGRYALLEYLVLSNEARTELLKALITEGLGGITLLMQSLVEKFGQTKLQAARVGFESGMITEEVFRSIYVEYQTMELLNSHG